ncbi:MAG: hypothetical protein MZV70_61060 [Desulfobacterales bacterium]|nr:hypothetical protein [Desulfobacterales bacterium]
MLELVRYIHLNPLRAGVVQDIEALRGYPRCGHSTLAGQKCAASGKIPSMFCTCSVADCGRHATRMGDLWPKVSIWVAGPSSSAGG